MEDSKKVRHKSITLKEYPKSNLWDSRYYRIDFTGWNWSQKDEKPEYLNPKLIPSIEDYIDVLFKLLTLLPVQIRTCMNRHVVAAFEHLSKPPGESYWAQDGFKFDTYKVIVKLLTKVKIYQADLASECNFAWNFIDVPNPYLESNQDHDIYDRRRDDALLDDSIDGTQF